MDLERSHWKQEVLEVEEGVCCLAMSRVSYRWKTEVALEPYLASDNVSMSLLDTCSLQLHLSQQLLLLADLPTAPAGAVTRVQ